MLRRLVVLLGTLFVGVAMSAPASATTIDFATGLAGTGGSIQVLADGSILGTNIPIGSVIISGAPVNDGTYVVTGTATGTGLLPNPGFGSLNFYTGSTTTASYITLTGCIAGSILDSGLGVGSNPCSSPLLLLSGTISSFDSTRLSQGLISATGADAKNAQLLAALGMPTNTQFAFFGSSFAVSGGLTAGGAAQVATSTDIRNNSAAIPEPGSLLLLGSGALMLASRARRRFAKKLEN